MKKLLICFLIIVCSIACRELVQDEFPALEPIPVINCILVADSVIKVHVSLTGSLDTSRLTIVNNAIIRLFIDDQYEETIPLQMDGIYRSNAIAEPLKTYSCEISVPGYPVINCRDSIPEPSILTDIIHINQAGIDEEGTSYPAIKFNFSVYPDQMQYFEAVIWLLKEGSVRIAQLEEISDPVLLNEGIPVAAFSNELIENDTYTMTINYTTGSASSTNSSAWVTELYPCIFELRSISFDYYQYVKQLYLYEQGRYPEFIGSSLSTYQLYSNIDDGYGIFAGYSSVRSDTIFPDPYIINK